MNLLRIEEISYRIFYIEDGGKYFAYKKVKDRWEVWTNQWKEVKDKSLIDKLEELIPRT